MSASAMQGGHKYSTLSCETILVYVAVSVNCEYTWALAVNGCMPYADDVILISTSIIQLQAMLDVCVRYGGEMDTKFNAKKSFKVGRN